MKMENTLSEQSPSTEPSSHSELYNSCQQVSSILLNQGEENLLHMDEEINHFPCYNLMSLPGENQKPLNFQNQMESEITSQQLETEIIKDQNIPAPQNPHINNSNNIFQKEWIQKYLNNQKIINILNLPETIPSDLQQKNENNLFNYIQNKNLFTLDEQQLQKTIVINNQQKNLSFVIDFQNPKEVREKVIDKLFKMKEGMSRTKNYSKQLITFLIRFLKHYVIPNINISCDLRDELFEIVDQCRKSGRVYNGKKVIRSDMFTHIHYGVLFLKFTDNSLKNIQRNENLKKIHKSILKIDLQSKQENNIISKKSKRIQKCQKKNQQQECSFRIIQKDQCNINPIQLICSSGSTENIEKENQIEPLSVNNQEDVEYINFLKECLYQLVNQYLSPILKNCIIQEHQNNQQQQIQYQEIISKLFLDLQILNQGVYRKKF